MNNKEIAAIGIALALLVAAYFFLGPAPEPPPQANNYSAPFLNEPPSSIEEFAQSLLLSGKVCIVENLRGLEGYPLTRNNIMQCGVDFSGSEGLVGKELAIYALEGEACITAEGTATLDECYSEILSSCRGPASSIIWIERGNSSAAYTSHMLVQVNEQYVQGTCSAHFGSPALLPGEEANETAAGNSTVPGQANETMDSESPPAQQNETVSPGGEGSNETGTPAEPGGEEEPGTEGDSHTFP
jgi:hypothetical protein